MRDDGVWSDIIDEGNCKKVGDYPTITQSFEVKDLRKLFKCSYSRSWKFATWTNLRINNDWILGTEAIAIAHLLH